MALARVAMLSRPAASLAVAPVLASRLAPSTARFYHEAVHDHFSNPRNVGSLDKGDADVGSALVGKASCGDVIKLQVKVGKDGIIEDAKFKTFGCGSAIASSSLATEMIIGKPVEEASQLKNTDISSHLKLPPVKIHCSVLAEEAIQAAIADYKQKQSKAQEAAKATA
mmetsp:Transcript_18321/g.39129  ORF Transcript_18321/g.39129 Transcript_18321/m.39129 type:complete len:168 (+) Transcript_18321:114-617(+)|eukprot:CAMPEP_0206594048 /NCGR_PEP_ID=MMETSP0325_2-20121206/42100_1 /ASSEMBLY_ACC=CAM_ASM_000347 /TAXON_ID=2866 /ORGANISM="Crypthecodinium cohnii, Strain Seligo" /LENGTH=167 /DNA_ID=CAMNT_0054104351 /DNA_START=51 /DNA_END=554 /DNA_ORIENTATION=-